MPFSLDFASMILWLRMKSDGPQNRLLLGTNIQKLQGCIGLHTHQDPQTLEQFYIQNLVQWVQEDLFNE
jgi:hypothetical protein